MDVPARHAMLRHAACTALTGEPSATVPDHPIAPADGTQHTVLCRANMHMPAVRHVHLLAGMNPPMLSHVRRSFSPFPTDTDPAISQPYDTDVMHPAPPYWLRTRYASMSLRRFSSSSGAIVSLSMHRSTFSSRDTWSWNNSMVMEPAFRCNYKAA